MRRISKVAERYSTAFFQGVKSLNLLEKVEEDFAQLNTLVTENNDVLAILSNPLIPREKLESFLQAIGREMKLQDITIKLLRLLARRRRTNVLNEIIEHFNDLLKLDRNQLSVQIKAHSSIAKPQLDELNDVLHKGTGRKILLDVDVDASILGGIIIQYGSYKLDYSLKNKLAELKHELERLG